MLPCSVLAPSAGKLRSSKGHDTTIYSAEPAQGLLEIGITSAGSAPSFLHHTSYDPASIIFVSLLSSLWTDGARACARQGDPLPTLCPDLLPQRRLGRRLLRAG